MSGVNEKLETNDVSNIGGLTEKDKIAHFPENELHTRLDKRSHLEPRDGTTNSETTLNAIKSIHNMYNPHPKRGYHISPNQNSTECSKLRNKAYNGDAEYEFAVKLIMKTCGTQLEYFDFKDLLHLAALKGHKKATILYDYFDKENIHEKYHRLLRNDPGELLNTIFDEPTKKAATAAAEASPAALSSGNKYTPNAATDAAAAHPKSVGNVLKAFSIEKAAAKEAAKAAAKEAAKAAANAAANAAATAKAAANAATTAKGGKRRKRTRRTTRKFLKKRSTHRKR